MSKVIPLLIGIYVSLLTSIHAETRLPTVIVIGNSNQTRNSLLPNLGTTTYHLSGKQLSQQAQGENAGFNQVLLRTPGISQDSYGQVHIRGDHSHLQYRINNVMIPSGIRGFGQELDPHFVKSIDIMTGALPAQYGLNTAGIIDITTKEGDIAPAGRITIETGSFNTFHPSIEYGGSKEKLSYFLNGSYLQNSLGIENPTSQNPAIHDDTQQYKGFGYATYQLDETSALNLILGGSSSHFQIPTTPEFPTFNEAQQENSHYEVLSYQVTKDNFNGQISLLNRGSNTLFTPDVSRQHTAQSFQGEGSLALNPDHTLRSGFTATAQQAKTHTDTEGTYDKTGTLYGLYLQDKWILTEELTLNYGARFDTSTSFKTENQLSPRVSISYKLSPDTAMHAGYARYFTPAPVESTDSVKAERANYYNIGIRHQLISNLHIGLDGYYKDIEDLLDEGQFGESLIFSPFNYKKGKVYGIETNLSYSNEGLSAYTNLALSYATGRDLTSGQFLFEEDELDYIKNNDISLDHDQRWTLSSGVAYSCLEYTLYSDILYGSGLRHGFSNTGNLPSYITMNLGGSYTFKMPTWGEWIIRLDILNLWDTLYTIRDGSGIGVGSAQYGARQGFYTSVSMKF